MSLKLIPEQASSVAPSIDVLFYTLLALSVLVIVGVTVAIVWFSVRYRRGAAVERKDVVRRPRWELTWTLIPLALFLGVCVWAGKLYFDLYTPPRDALPVYVVGKQWMWKVQHPGGQREINQLHVPRGTPVKLIMTSEDVIHSFFVPPFRIKQDVVPGRYTTAWFTATRDGEFELFCAEFCGTDHSKMIGRVVVMEPQAYQRWLQDNLSGKGLAAQGSELFRSLGCSGCHSANSSVHAPLLEGVFGGQVHLQNGETVVANERYIRDSILQPASQIVAGYQPIMPSFKGQVDEEQLLKLVAYIQSIGVREGNQP